MKPIQFILLITTLFLASCSSKQTIKSDKLVLPKSGQIGIYYFRTPLHCETCDAIEELIADELAGKYTDLVKEGKIVFRQYNLDDPGVADFALKFDVVFKSVILLKNNQKIDLTNDLFLYILPKPEKARKLFEESLNKL